MYQLSGDFEHTRFLIHHKKQAFPPTSSQFTQPGSKQSYNKLESQPICFTVSCKHFVKPFMRTIHTHSYIPKGQTISKTNYDVLNSSKKRMKLAILSRKDAQDSEICLFIGRFAETINCFRDLLTYRRQRNKSFSPFFYSRTGMPQ